MNEKNKREELPEISVYFLKDANTDGGMKFAIHFKKNNIRKVYKTFKEQLSNYKALPNGPRPTSKTRTVLESKNLQELGGI